MISVMSRVLSSKIVAEPNTFTTTQSIWNKLSYLHNILPNNCNNIISYSNLI